MSSCCFQKFKEETSNFRALINLLKSTVGSTYSQTNVFSKMLTLGTRAVDGILTTFQSPKEQTRKSHDIVKKEASIELLTRMWNMGGASWGISSRELPHTLTVSAICNPPVPIILESGVPSMIVSMATNPSIKVSKTIFISVPMKDRPLVGCDAVECLILAAKSLPFSVPKGGVLNADGQLTPLTRDVPSKSQASSEPDSPSATSNQCLDSPPVEDVSAWRGDELVIHFHGGGFVSGSPYTHGTLNRKSS